MTLHEILFILLSAFILVFALLTVTSRRILRAATYLLIVLVSTAGVYGVLQYEFMAAVQVALYAGGIVVIIVFSILLTHHIQYKSQPIPLTRKLLGYGVAAAGAGITIPTILSHNFNTPAMTELNVDVKTIGEHIVNTGQGGYALPFEVISILLLAALIGAIVVAKKDSEPSANPENK